MLTLARRSVRPTSVSIAIAGSLLTAGCVGSRDFTVDKMKAYVLDLPAGSSIDVSTGFGDIDLASRGQPLPDWTQRADGPGAISATSEQTVVIAWFRSTDQERLDAVTMTAEVVDGALTLKPQWPAQQGRSKDAIYFAIRTPHEAGAITAKTGYGDVSVQVPHASADIDTGYGDVDVSNSGGSLVVRTGYGDVDAANVHGPLEIDSGYGDFDIELATAFDGTLSLTSGYGDIDLESAALTTGTIQLVTGYGSVNMQLPDRTLGRELAKSKRSATLRGDVSGPDWVVKTGYGDISADLGD